MPVIPEIAAFHDELVAIRRDFHSHPEIGFQERRTASIVAEHLTRWGIETLQGLAETGVVGVIRGEPASRSVGLRADMDALPVEELADVPFRSRVPGCMHACGHDGHMAMLLGAAKYLSATRRFSGSAVFIFQPAEEGLGGARAMLKDGLFDRFPCDEIYALHNDPNGSPERLSVKPGPAMAGADSFDVHIRGAGAHGAMPDRARDPVVAAIFLAAQLQTIVSRNIPASEPAVLSVTQIHSGTAYNVIPSTARLSGTIRYFSDEIGTKIGQRVRTLADGIATAYELEVDVEIRNTFNVLINDAALTHELVAAAQEIVGSENASLTSRVRTGSDDFAEFLRVVPGAYASLGHASSIPLHNERFLLDENILPVGASIFARLVERRATA